METLWFDEAAHTYTLKPSGRVLASTTTILKTCGLIDTTFFAKDGYAMNRGTFVHKTTELYDRGTLDEAALDPALRGYLDAWIKFRAECPMTWTKIEEPMADETWGFAGTADRIGTKFVLDIKTSATVQPWWGYQLAGYALLGFTAGAAGLVKRYSLRLRGDGTYRMDEHKDKKDFDVFRAALVIHHAKGGSK